MSVVQIRESGKLATTRGARVGNSVPPLLMKAIAEHVRDRFFVNKSSALYLLFPILRSPSLLTSRMATSRDLESRTYSIPRPAFGPIIGAANPLTGSLMCLC